MPVPHLGLPGTDHILLRTVTDPLRFPRNTDKPYDRMGEAGNPDATRCRNVSWNDMNKPGSRLSEAEAHQELMLMDSRVAGMPLESFFDRLRRMDLPYADVLARFREVLSEKRLCGGKHIHVGKIVGNEILEFMEGDPDLPSGVQLEAALRGLGQLAPFLGSVLAPLSAEVESQGFGRLVGRTEFREKTDRRALVFLRRTADILNLTRHLLDADRSSMSLDVVSFEEPTFFELETSENPFDLDDLSGISPSCLAVAKVLVKISLADGDFGDQEKIIIAQTLEHMGETLSASQCERLGAEASKESIQEILKTVTDQPVIFKEKLLLLAMMATAADGRVETIEKKLLAQAAPVLGISTQRFSEIAKDAVLLIKTRQSSLAESAKSIAHSVARIVQSPPVPEPARADAPRQEAPRSTVPQVKATEPKNKPAIASSAPTSSPPLARTESPRYSSPETPPVPKIWRCPACHMPQFQEFDECPQCGVIVSKFREKHDRSWGDREDMIDLPVDPADEPLEEPVRQMPDPERRSVPSFCAACSVPLPAGAKFCPSCGTRVN